MTHIIHLASTDSTKVYDNNEAGDFILELAKPIEIDGIWEIAIIDYEIGVTQTSDTSRLKILCDICVESNSNGKMERLLGIIHIKSNGLKRREYVNPTYVLINSKKINNIHFNIKNDVGDTPSFIVSPFRCTLHLRKS